MLDRPTVSAAVEGAEFAYVTVQSASGPMVTPLLFAARDDRLWMVMPSSSAKVKAIARHATIGVTLCSQAGSAVLQGDARVVDPRRPPTLLSSIPDTLLSPRGVGSYLAGNLRHLAGMVGPAALAPRSLAAVRPVRALVLGTDGALVDTAGWPPASAAPVAPATIDLRGTELDLHGVPDALASLTTGRMSVLVGWMTPTGPLALPGAWDPGTRRAAVSADAFEAAGCLERSAGCILFDGTEGTNLNGKTGLVVRGDGEVASASSGTLELALRPRRLSWWEGDRSDSAKVA